MDNIIGVGSRLEAHHSEQISDLTYQEEIDLFKNYEYLYSLGDLAHILSLYKSKVYSLNQIKPIVKYLIKELELRPNYSEKYNGKFGDFFSNRLKRLLNKNELGDSALYINSGRPRRESTNITFILFLKERFYDLSVCIEKLFLSIANKSLSNLEIFMSDFTYWHSTQPTSFGHFLASYLGGIERQLRCLIFISDLINCSPAGAGSSNGTMFGLDRKYHADLLNFKEVISNTKDATWTSDIFGSISSWMCLFSGTLSKLTEDLLILSSEGFRIIQCADEHSRISVIMPHKKNPFQLSVCRGNFNTLSSKSEIYLSSIRNSSGYPDSRHVFYIELSKDLERLEQSIKMLTGVIDKLKIDKEKALSFIKNKNTYTADLSQELTLINKIPDRESHKILSDAIKLSEIENKDFDLISLNKILEKNGYETLSENLFSKITTPNYILERRLEEGSSNQKICKKSIKESIKKMRQDVKEIKNIKLNVGLIRKISNDIMGKEN